MMEYDMTTNTYHDQNSITNILKPYVLSNLRTDHPDIDTVIIDDILSNVIAKFHSSFLNLRRTIMAASDYKISHHVFLKLRHKFSAIRLKSRIDHESVREIIQYVNYLHTDDPLRMSLRKRVEKYNQIDYPNITTSLIEQSASILDNILGIIKKIHVNSDALLHEIENNSQYNSIECCVNCNCLTTNEISVSGNLRFYCPSCVDMHLRSCSRCGKMSYSEEFSSCPDQTDDVTGLSIRICNICWHEVYGTCDSCRITARQGNLKSIQFDKVVSTMCKSCHNRIMKVRFKECSIRGCSNNFDTMNRRVIRASIYSPDDVITFGFDNYCDHHLNMITTVLPYGYQPSIRPMNTHKHEGELKKNTATFGFELEFEVRHDKAEVDVVSQIVKNTFGYTKYYICSDASLGKGAEVISNPFTYQWYRANKKELIRLHTVMTNAGALFDHKRIGFHVHQNKDSFNASQIYKLTTLFADCDTLDILEPIFGRTEGEYNVPLELNKHARIKAAKEKSNVGADHYDVFHCPPRRKTNEFRMFAGPHSPYHLLAYIETIFALNEWSDQVSSNCVHAYDFLEFCKTQNTYGNLKRLALGKNIDKPLKKGKK